MTTLPPWDPDEYDRQVKESRKRARRQERLLRQSPITERDVRGSRWVRTRRLKRQKGNDNG